MQDLYPTHFSTIQKRFNAALSATQFDGVVIHSGSPKRIFLDDNNYPFKSNPYFGYWVPMQDCPDSFLVIKQGTKPQLLLLQPIDFWHTQPRLLSGPWLELFDVETYSSLDEIESILKNPTNRTSWIGDNESMASKWGYASVNDQALLNHLDYDRAEKTQWEIANLREANRLAAIAHLAAKEAFLADADELSIHHAYLNALHDEESNLPYRSIVALNENGAVLHYDRYERIAPDTSRSFLIDAGAKFNGYIADITRTWAKPEHSDYQAFIDRMDVEQQALISTLTVGKDYRDYHLDMHLRLAQIMREFELLNCSAEEAIDKHITRAFFPHGLGHLIGLQTHDVGGHQLDHRGTLADSNDGHPFLRLRRKITSGMTVTIEPGCYVIDQLLEPHQGDRAINWDRVNWLRPFGGVRIEDTVLIDDTGAHNLTRPHV